MRVCAYIDYIILRHLDLANHCNHANVYPSSVDFVMFHSFLYIFFIAHYFLTGMPQCTMNEFETSFIYKHYFDDMEN